MASPSFETVFLPVNSGRLPSAVPPRGVGDLASGDSNFREGTGGIGEFPVDTIGLKNLFRHLRVRVRHVLIAEGDLAEVKRCIGEGQPVDKRNTRRQTALHCACAGGHRDVVNFLLAE